MKEIPRVVKKCCAAEAEGIELGVTVDRAIDSVVYNLWNGCSEAVRWVGKAGHWGFIQGTITNSRVELGNLVSRIGFCVSTACYNVDIQ